MKKTSTPRIVRYITRTAVIAALYSALTLALSPIGYGAVQFRISEALTVLPFFFPEAVPGLFIGCIVSNIISPYGVLDLIFGSLATLLAAFITRKIRIKWFAPMPAVLFNALIVGALIAYYSAPASASVFMASFAFNALTVGAGELVVCYGLGLPLILILERNKLFKKESNK